MDEARETRGSHVGERARIFARDGDIEGLLRELAAFPTVAQSRDWGGWTALHYAAQSGRVACAQLLLAHGADPNQLDSDEWLPLHVAALNDSAGVARLLLSMGCDPRRRTGSGRSAWQLSAPEGTIRTLGVLVRGDSDLSDSECVGDEDDDTSDSAGGDSTDASMDIDE
jgi:serine/threonine-protein phosphatase 6 regulatory ankyrin repeat subunit A